MEGIWRAAHDGDLAQVQRLVRRDPGLLNAKEMARYPPRTPLMCASQEGHEGVARWLLAKGAAIHELDALGYNALALACRQGHPPVVKLLLERGADPTIPDGQGGTPLLQAACNRRLEVGPSYRKGDHQQPERVRPHGVVVGLQNGPWGDGEGAARERGRRHDRRRQGHDPHGHRQAGSPRCDSRRGPPRVRGGVGGEVLPFAFPLSALPARRLTVLVPVVAGRRRSGPACSASRAPG
jgi:hypothetical protein